MTPDLVEYYARRAAEYEDVYRKPERQTDLTGLKELCSTVFKGHRVLELACGTGFWTQVIAPVADSLVACDINPEVLEIARTKDYRAASQVRFVQADSYNLPEFDQRFTAAFAGFWWSHVPKPNLAGFLSSLHSKLAPGAFVMFIDNRYVLGSSTPVARTDEHGNTYQQRRLRDGSVYEVLKNFPTESELRMAAEPLAASVDVNLLEYYWVLRYRTRQVP